MKAGPVSYYGLPLRCTYDVLYAHKDARRTASRCWIDALDYVAQGGYADPAPPVLELLAPYLGVEAATVLPQPHGLVGLRVARGDIAEDQPPGLRGYPEEGALARHLRGLVAEHLGVGPVHFQDGAPLRL